MNGHVACNHGVHKPRRGRVIAAEIPATAVVIVPVINRINAVVDNLAVYDLQVVAVALEVEAMAMAVFRWGHIPLITDHAVYERHVHVIRIEPDPVGPATTVGLNNAVCQQHAAGVYEVSTSAALVIIVAHIADHTAVGHCQVGRRTSAVIHQQANTMLTVAVVVPVGDRQTIQQHVVRFDLDHAARALAVKQRRVGIKIALIR